MSSSLVFIATSTVPSSVNKTLSPFGETITLDKYDEDTLVQSVSNALGMVVRIGPQITRRVIEAAPHLRVIGRSGAGYENVDLQAAADHGIPVVYAPGAAPRPVAEGALAMLLSLIKRLPDLDKATRAGQWAKRNTIPVGDLAGGTLGIIGLGRIGKELVNLVKPFGTRIIAYDPLLPAEEYQRLQIESVSLDQLLEQSDFISLHAPLTKDTQGLLDRRRLEQVKQGAILVNLARGGLIASLDDLYVCLQSGRLGAVALDVFEQEPPDVSHPLFSHPNTLFSPHATGASQGAQQAIFNMMCEGMVAVLEQRSWPHVANGHLLRSAKESQK